MAERKEAFIDNEETQQVEHRLHVQELVENFLKRYHYHRLQGLKMSPPLLEMENDCWIFIEQNQPAHMVDFWQFLLYNDRNSYGIFLREYCFFKTYLERR